VDKPGKKGREVFLTIGAKSLPTLFS